MHITVKIVSGLYEINVIAYRISEIGAMGPAGTMTCLESNGEHFEVNYLSEKTPREEIKKASPG